MKTLRDAGLLLVGLLLLTSVKIAPVEGTASVVPLTHAGVPTLAAGLELPVTDDPSSRIERFDVEIEQDPDCRASVIVIGPDDEAGERRVGGALTACNKG